MSDDATQALPLRVRLAEGAVLALVAVGCLWFQLSLPGKAVAEEDYRAAAQVLQAEAQPGDVVLLHPWWTERARLFMPEGLWVVGYQGSDGAALELNPRIWVLDQPGQPRAGNGAFEAAFLPGRTAVGAERRFGNLALRLYTNGRYRLRVFDARDALARAQVYLEQPGGARTPCAWTGAGHRCPSGEVLVEWREVAFEPRRCVRFWPPGGAQRLVAEWDQVPASASLTLLAGYTWDRGFFRDNVSDAALGLDVNGQATPLPLPRGLEGLQRAEVKGTPDRSKVRVWVEAQNPHAREICFELYGFGGSG